MKRHTWHRSNHCLYGLLFVTQ